VFNLNVICTAIKSVSRLMLGPVVNASRVGGGRHLGQGTKFYPLKRKGINNSEYFSKHAYIRKVVMEAMLLLYSTANMFLGFLNIVGGTKIVILIFEGVKFFQIYDNVFHAYPQVISDPYRTSMYHIGNIESWKYQMTISIHYG